MGEVRPKDERKGQIVGSGVILGGGRGGTAGKTVPADHGFPATRQNDRFCAVPRVDPGNVGLDLDHPYDHGVRLSMPPIHISSEPLRHTLEKIRQ